MGASAIPTAIAARDFEELRAAIVDELIPVIDAATDPQTWDPRELETLGGNVWKAVAWQDRFWWRDDTSVAAHDGITCIILLDGGHYLTNDVEFPGSVESRTVTAPPDSAGIDPSVIGKAWRVPAGASGTWSGHEDDVAMGSARGWQFKPPTTGDLHYVIDDTVYEHFAADDTWTDGIPLGILTASIPLSALIWDRRVENQTTNSPPASWANGVAYIIGSSASGAWSGNAGKLAIAESAGTLAGGDTFTIYTQYDGLEVYDKNLKTKYRWSSAASAWQTAVSGYGLVSLFTDDTSSAINGLTPAPSSGGYQPSTTAPTSTVDFSKITESLQATSVRADYAGQKIEVQYDATCTALSATFVGANANSLTEFFITAAAFIDSESNARDWKTVFRFGQTAGAIDTDKLKSFNPRSIYFDVTLGDTSSHTLTIMFLIGVQPASPSSSINFSASSMTLLRRRLRVRKLS